MGYLHPSQLFSNAFHLAICNAMTPGCQYIVFIPVYAPLVTGDVLHQTVPKLGAPVHCRHSPPQFSGFCYSNLYLFTCLNNISFYTDPGVRFFTRNIERCIQEIDFSRLSLFQFFIKILVTGFFFLS